MRRTGTRLKQPPLPPPLIPSSEPHRAPGDPFLTNKLCAPLIYSTIVTLKALTRRRLAIKTLHSEVEVEGGRTWRLHKSAAAALSYPGCPSNPAYPERTQLSLRSLRGGNLRIMPPIDASSTLLAKAHYER